MASSNLKTNLIDFKSGNSTIAKATATTDTLNFVGSGSNDCKLTGVAYPTADKDAATKKYVDDISKGIYWKNPVRVSTTINGTLSTAFANGQTVDGISLATGNRILIKDQFSGVENGIYIVQASGAPIRASDMAAGSNAKASSLFVEEGNVNADTAWVCTNDSGSDVVGTNALVFTLFSKVNGLPGGSNTQIQYNNNGSLAGSSTFTTNGTNVTLDGGDMFIRGSDSLRFGNNNELRIVAGIGVTNIAVTNSFSFSSFAANDPIIFTLGSTTNSSDFRIRSSDGTEKFRIDGSGQTNIVGNLNVGNGIDINADNKPLTFGNSSDLSIVYNGLDSVTTSSSGDYIVDNTSATGSTIMRLGSNDINTDFQVQNNSGNFIMKANGDRTVVCASTISAVSFNSTSDASVKKDIQPIDNALKKINAIDAYEYRFNFIENDQLRYGVLAQDLKEAGLGNLVSEDHESGKLKVDYNNLVGLLIGSVKELNEKVNKLSKLV